MRRRVYSSWDGKHVGGTCVWQVESLAMGLEGCSPADLEVVVGRAAHQAVARTITSAALLEQVRRRGSGGGCGDGGGGGGPGGRERGGKWWWWWEEGWWVRRRGQDGERSMRGE